MYNKSYIFEVKHEKLYRFRSKERIISIDKGC